MRLVWESEATGIPANGWHNGLHGGYDSPIVADKKVYMVWQMGSGDVLDTTITNKRYKEDGPELRQCQAVAADYHVLCVDARTGRTVWSRILDVGPNMYQRRKRPGTHHSPCWHAGRLYCQSTLGRVYCLDGATGEEIWSVDMPVTKRQREVLKMYRAAERQHPYRGAVPKGLEGGDMPFSPQVPLQVIGDVVIAHGGPVQALDIKDGSVRWETRARGHCSPLAWHDGKQAYVLFGNELLHASTGERCWGIKDAWTSATPTMGDGHVVYVMKKSIACYGFDASEAIHRWTVDEYTSGSVGGVIVNGWYFGQVERPKDQMPKGVSELLVGHDLRSGERVGPLEIPGTWQTLCTSLVATDGLIFGQAGSGYSGMWMASADPKNFGFVGQRMPTVKTDMRRFAEIAPANVDKKPLDYCLTSTPAIVAGRMYFRGTDRLYCYDLRRTTP